MERIVENGNPAPSNAVPVFGEFDVDAARVWTVSGSGDLVYTMYGADGTLLYRDNATTGVKTDYLRAGGLGFARHNNGVWTWIPVTVTRIMCQTLASGPRLEGRGDTKGWAGKTRKVI